MVVILRYVFKQYTAYVLRISDWSSDVCSSDLWLACDVHPRRVAQPRGFDQKEKRRCPSWIWMPFPKVTSPDIRPNMPERWRGVGIAGLGLSADLQILTPARSYSTRAPLHRRVIGMRTRMKWSSCYQVTRFWSTTMAGR